MRDEEKNILVWVKGNYTTVFGIIIILLVVWYNSSTIDSQKVDAVKECNEYWHTQIERVCPAAEDQDLLFVGFMNGS